jgi:hypothetical protein
MTEEIMARTNFPGQQVRARQPTPATRNTPMSALASPTGTTRRGNNSLAAGKRILNPASASFLLAAANQNLDKTSH